MTLQINLVGCTQTLVEQVACKEATQKMVALTYAMALKSAAHGADNPDWGKINRAILSRWKMSGLERVKKRAWDLCAGKVQP